MESNEGIYAALSKLKEAKKGGLCSICHKDHKSKKEDEIKFTVTDKNDSTVPDGWSRKESMKGKFKANGSAAKKIYANSDPSDPGYDTEGHHCIGYASFVGYKEKTKGDDPDDPDGYTLKGYFDRFIKLNYYLEKFGYKPNHDDNCVQLPGRRWNGKPSQDITQGGEILYVKALVFMSFWKSISLGRPLQMHIGSHAGGYRASSDRLIRRVYEILTDPDECEKADLDSTKDRLLKAMEHAENYAFNRTIKYDSFQWRLHPGHVNYAEKLYSKNKDSVEIYSVGTNKVTRTVTDEHGKPVKKKFYRKVHGYGGDASDLNDGDVEWQTQGSLTLPEGEFEGSDERT